MTDTEHNEKTKKEKRDQPLIIEFYNLQLKSGPYYNRDLVDYNNLFNEEYMGVSMKPEYEKLDNENIDKKYPDKAEQIRIKFFLEKHDPELKTHLGLKWYQDQTESCWFKSNYFLRFADEYLQIKQIIDDYIYKRQISGTQIRWLNAEMSKYYKGNIPILKMINIKNKKEYPAFPLPNDFDKIKYWNLDNYKVDLAWRSYSIHINGEFYYGISIDQLMGKIKSQLYIIISEKMKLKFCEFEGGKRNPTVCHNLFIMHKISQKYCSKKCYDRARRCRGYEKEQLKPLTK